MGNPQTWSQPLAYNHSKFFDYIYTICASIVAHCAAIDVNSAAIMQHNDQLVCDPKFMTQP